MRNYPCNMRNALNSILKSKIVRITKGSYYIPVPHQYTERRFLRTYKKLRDASCPLNFLVNYNISLIVLFADSWSLWSRGAAIALLLLPPKSSSGVDHLRFLRRSTEFALARREGGRRLRRQLLLSLNYIAGLRR